MSNNIRSEVVDDQLFVYYKEALIYKRWLKAARSMVFESVGGPTSSEDRDKNSKKRMIMSDIESEDKALFEGLLELVKFRKLVDTEEEDCHEIEDWEDFETIDEARNEIKRLLEDNSRLREAHDNMKEVVFNRIAGLEHVTTLLRKELEVFEEIKKKE